MSLFVFRLCLALVEHIFFIRMKLYSSIDVSTCGIVSLRQFSLVLTAYLVYHQLPNIDAGLNWRLQVSLDKHDPTLTIGCWPS